LEEGSIVRELPKGWGNFAIQELVEFNPKNDIDNETVVGFIPMPLMSTEFKQEPLFEERKWHEVKKGYTHFQNGDVLLAKITPCFENGKAGIPKNLPNGLGAGSTEYFVCRANDDLLCSEYLLAYFKTPEFMKLGELAMTGSVGHKRVAKEYLLTSEIPLPPLNEQKRIADRLDLLLTRIDKTKAHLDRIPPLLKRFRQSVLAAATSGKLTEDWREAHGVGDFKITHLSEVAAGFSYGSSAKSSPSGLIPVLRMGNIQNGKLDWSDLVFTSDQVEIDKYKLVNGDVLFNRTNSPELVGKTTVYQGEQPAIYAGYLIRIRCGESLLPDYLNYCLNSPAGRDYCWAVKSDGVSQSNINAKKLAEFEFELPTIEEQHEIVRRVETLFAKADRIEAQYKTARQQVDRLTPALLAKAFRGELVPQDPNDEPASVLLERVKAVKGGEEKKKGRSRNVPKKAPS
jgi:type I restriction enzyme, S subunit